MFIRLLFSIQQNTVKILHFWFRFIDGQKYDFILNYHRHHHHLYSLFRLANNSEALDLKQPSTD